MNKSAVYLAIFAALCVLTGVLVGASIAKRATLPWHGPGREHFTERAERFMGQWPKGPGERMGGGPMEMFTAKLGLSGEQKIKVAEILEKARQEIEEVGKNVRNSIVQIKEKGDKQIMDILTPQQQKKFKALQKEFEKKFGAKGLRIGHGQMGQDGERGNF